MLVSYHAATLAVDAVMRIRKHLNLEHIHIIKKSGGSMRDSYLDDVRAVVTRAFMRCSFDFHSCSGG